MARLPIVERLISEEEYLSHCYEPDCEFDDGVIVKRNVGEFNHSFLQTIMASLFINNTEARGVYSLIAQRMRIAPRKYRIPDLCMLRLDAPAENILNQPPLIAIEIFSSEDRLRRVEQKALEFRGFGVEHVWVIDPRKRTVFQCGENGLEKVENGELAIAGTPILVRVPELFEKLDQMRARGGRR